MMRLTPFSTGKLFDRDKVIRPLRDATTPFRCAVQREIHQIQRRRATPSLRVHNFDIDQRHISAIGPQTARPGVRRQSQRGGRARSDFAVFTHRCARGIVANGAQRARLPGDVGKSEQKTVCSARRSLAIGR